MRWINTSRRFLVSDELSVKGLVDGQSRIRVNSKQTAKGEWYFDVTIEYGINVLPEPLAGALKGYIDAIRQRFLDDGEKVAGQSI
jgi:hypothetical protein